MKKKFSLNFRNIGQDNHYLTEIFSKKKHPIHVN